MLFNTLYRTPHGNKVPNTLYARDFEHAKELAALRGMDEEVQEPVGDFYWGGYRPTMPSEHLRQGSGAKAMHALIWVSMIATRARTQAFDILNDYGVVHRLAHYNENAESSFFGSGLFGHGRGPAAKALRDFERARPMRIALIEFERSVPGVHPCWALSDREREADAARELAGIEEERGRLLVAKEVERRREEAEYAAFMGKVRPDVSDQIVDRRLTGSELRFILRDDLYSNHDSYAFDLRGDPDRKGKGKRRNNPGSRDFHLHQRDQRQRARAGKADLLAKMKGAVKADLPTFHDELEDSGMLSGRISMGGGDLQSTPKLAPVTGRLSSNEPPRMQSLPMRSQGSTLAEAARKFFGEGGVGKPAVLPKGERIIGMDLGVAERAVFAVATKMDNGKLLFDLESTANPYAFETGEERKVRELREARAAEAEVPVFQPALEFQSQSRLHRHRSDREIVREVQIAPPGTPVAGPPPTLRFAGVDYPVKNIKMEVSTAATSEAVQRLGVQFGLVENTDPQFDYHVGVVVGSSDG